MLKHIGKLSITLAALAQLACSGPRLGGLVESSVSPGERLEVTGLSYRKSLHIIFPSAGTRARPSSVAVLPGGGFALVDRDAGLAGVFAGTGDFSSYLEMPSGFHPTSVASGAGLGLYLMDPVSSEIYRYDSRGSLAGLAYSAEIAATLVDMCFDKTGRVYLTDRAKAEVAVIDPALGTERRFGGFGVEEGMFVDPAGLAVDQRGLVYVCDRGNSRIQVLDEWGGVVKVWGLKGDGCVARPKAVSVDRWGNAFVLDEGCSCLRVLNPKGTETVRLEGKGPGLGFLERPEDLELDSTRLIVADPVDGEVQVFEIQYATYR